MKKQSVKKQSVKKHVHMDGAFLFLLEWVLKHLSQASFSSIFALLFHTAPFKTWMRQTIGRGSDLE